MPVGYPLLHGECMGGGRGWASQILLTPAGKAGAEFAPGAVNPPKIPELAEGFYCPARARAPAHEVQRDFNAPRRQPLTSPGSSGTGG